MQTPPTLETRVKIASQQLVNDQESVKQAQEKLLPFQQKVDEIAKQVSSNKSALDAAEKSLKDAISAVQKAKISLDLAITDLANKTKIQNEKSLAHEAKKKELSTNQQKHTSQSENFNKWNQRANQRSEQLSQIKESYQNANEAQNQNQDDASYSDAVTKAKLAMEAMEKSYLHASNMTAQHKKEMEKYAALNVSLDATVAQASQSSSRSKTGIRRFSSKQSKNGTIHGNKLNKIRWP